MEDKIGFSVYFSKSIYDELKAAKQREGRSLNQQVIYWVKLGKLLDENPEIKTALLLKQQLR